MYDNYYNDGRVIAGLRRDWCESIDEAKMTAVVLLDLGHPELCETPETVYLQYEVCPTCEGRGHHTNPSIDCNGLSSEDFDQDPEFRQDYFGGRYDVQCYECKGKRVVPAIDRDRTPAEIVEAIDAKIKAESDYAAECAAERRMGY